MPGAAAARERHVAPRRGEQVRARAQKQLAYERRRRQERTRKQKRANYRASRSPERAGECAPRPSPSWPRA